MFRSVPIAVTVLKELLNWVLCICRKMLWICIWNSRFTFRMYFYCLLWRVRGNWLLACLDWFTFLCHTHRSFSCSCPTFFPTFSFMLLDYISKHDPYSWWCFSTHTLRLNLFFLHDTLIFPIRWVLHPASCTDAIKVCISLLVQLILSAFAVLQTH